MAFLYEIYAARPGEQEIRQETTPRRPEPGELLWVNMTNPDAEEVREVLGHIYECHPLIVEHVQRKLNRPRVTLYENHTYIALSALVRKGRPNRTEIIHIIYQEGLVITLHTAELAALSDLQERVEAKGGASLLTRGTGYVIYTLLDEIVDEKLTYLDHSQMIVDRIEDAVLTNPHYELNEQIMSERRGLQNERRLASAEREVFNYLLRPDSPCFGQDLDRYILDLYDHSNRIVEMIDARREQLTGLAELLMAATAQRTNEVMKVLTIVSTIFMPLTLLTGIYGMNFVHMPELQWRWGYPLVIIVMLSSVLGMLIFFRKRKWL